MVLILFRWKHPFYGQGWFHVVAPEYSVCVTSPSQSCCCCNNCGHILDRVSTNWCSAPVWPEGPQSFSRATPQARPTIRFFSVQVQRASMAPVQTSQTQWFVIAADSVTIPLLSFLGDTGLVTSRNNNFHPFAVSFLFLRQYFDPPKMSNDAQPKKLPATLRDSDFASRLELWLSTSLIGVVTGAAVVAPINYGCGRILQLPPSPSIEWSLVGKFLSFNQ